MNTELKTLREEFERIRMSEDNKTVLVFCSRLSQSDFIDYHFSLLKEHEVSDKLYQMLRNKFSNHGFKGEKLLIKKIEKEKDKTFQGDILQILGRYKYANGSFLKETAQYAREFLKSENDSLRFRAIIVLGWVGKMSDIKLLADSMFNDDNNQNRGWGASAIMQLFFSCPKIKDKALKYLQQALEKEEDYFTLACILTSIQEIANKKWGISSSTKPDDESKEKINTAKSKAVKFLQKYFKLI